MSRCRGRVSRALTALPSVDPAVVLAGGSLQPIEGYKGYGLALCIGLLTGVLARRLASTPRSSIPIGTSACEGDNSALVLAIDVAHFVDRDEFEERVDGLATAIRSGPRPRAADPIMVPGDREAAQAREITRQVRARAADPHRTRRPGRSARPVGARATRESSHEDFHRHGRDVHRCGARG